MSRMKESLHPKILQILILGGVDLTPYPPSRRGKGGLVGLDSIGWFRCVGLGPKGVIDVSRSIQFHSARPRPLPCMAAMARILQVSGAEVFRAVLYCSANRRFDNE